jgi:hypothetical protein
MSNRPRAGMSFLEILVATLVLGAALTPLIMMTLSTHRQISSVGRHLVGAQVARSVLDRLLQLPHDECRTEAERLMAAGAVLLRTDPAWQGMIALTGDGSIDPQAWERVLQDVTYEVRVDPAASGEEAGRMFGLRIVVSWSADGAGGGRRSYRIRTIKFQERL